MTPSFHSKRHLIVLVAGLLAGPFSFQTRAADGDGTPYDQRKDVVYGEVHGTGLLMDVFTPKSGANGLGIVDVVSGAWYSDRNKIRDHTLAQLYSIFCSRGYVVFAVRPGSKTRYTAAEMEQHVKLGIRYAKEHAAEHRIDPARLGLTGASAGGHLATLAALAPEPGKLEAKNPLDRHGTAVRAVGVFFPPTDLLDWAGDGKMADADLIGPLLFVGGAKGQSEDEMRARAKAASPFHRATRSDVPFFLIHGDADKTVPISHSRKFVEALKAAGTEARLLVKVGGGHPWMTLPEEVKILAEWFDEKLGAKPAAAAGGGR